MDKENKSYEKAVEDNVNKFYRSKPKTNQVMQKMKWFIARQAYFHYGEQAPQLPGSNEIMQEFLGGDTQEIMISDLFHS
jgi:hypothetical protein